MSRKNDNASSSENDRWVLTRRVFLRSTALAVTGLFFRPLHTYAVGQPPQPLVRFGLVTDSHYADIDPWGTRFYRESTDKMAECVKLMNEKKVDFVMHLGDFKNGAPSGNIENLQRLESIYARFDGPRYHVLGNHDMDSISKQQFQSVVENTAIDRDATFYSFDHGSVHFVVLDANFRDDGAPYDTGNFTWTDANVPKDQLEWLDADLSGTSGPTLVCIHQLLDSDEGNHYVRNAMEVRRILNRHPHVVCVFQGHQHAGQYNHLNRIHYYTLKAMVENSGMENSSYAIVQVYEDMSLEICGFRKAVSKELTAGSQIR